MHGNLKKLYFFMWVQRCKTALKLHPQVSTHLYLCKSFVCVRLHSLCDPIINMIVIMSFMPPDAQGLLCFLSFYSSGGKGCRSPQTPLTPASGLDWGMLSCQLVPFRAGKGNKAGGFNQNPLLNLACKGISQWGSSDREARGEAGTGHGDTTFHAGLAFCQLQGGWRARSEALSL